MGWIDADISLPDSPTEMVIVNISRFGYSPNFLTISRYKKGYGWCDIDRKILSKVTHWQPMPEPPE